MRITFYSLGCRLNEAELERIGQEFTRHGHTIVKNEKDGADILILNTCGVTTEAMRKSRNLARRLASHHPSLLVILGCAVNLDNNWEIPNDIPLLTITNEQKADAYKLIEAKCRTLPTMPERSAPAAATEPAVHPEIREQTHLRSFIKIQDGCNNACTYCAVHIARGREQSEPSDAILQDIRNCIDDGAREIILTGVQLGAWREDGNKLPYLLRRIEKETRIERIRLSSIEPWHIDENYWEIWQNPRFCPHFHIPLQSGCNDILKSMQRRTTVEKYSEIVHNLRTHIKIVRISTDLIVGFPGETEEMWQTTMQTLRHLQFEDLHLFRFSARPGTPAATMPNQINENVKRLRWAEAHACFHAMQAAQMKSYLGTEHSVLWETPDTDASTPEYNAWNGYTENYIRVEGHFPKSAYLRNTLSRVRLDGLLEDKMLAAVLPDHP